MADLDRVRRWADALIALHLDPSVWSFGFDRATTRAGLCSYSTHRITVSRHLASRYEDDEIHQVLLHEVAHAIAGPRAGHGPRWKAVASDLGYGLNRPRTFSGLLLCYNDAMPFYTNSIMATAGCGVKKSSESELGSLIV